MTGQTTADQTNDEHVDVSTAENETMPEDQPQENQSRKAVLRALALVEGQLQQAQTARTQIGDAAIGMRRGVHQSIEQLEQHGLRTLDEEERYRQLLLDRRHCDVVGTLNQGDES